MSSKRDQFLTACRNAKLDTVRWGVGAGGQSPGTRDDDGHTAIMITALGDKHKALQMLLDSCRRSRMREPIDFTDGRGEGKTALMMAAARGHEASCDELLYAGANYKMTCERGMTAADYARKNGYDGLARRIDRGGDSSEEEEEEEEDEEGFEGETSTQRSRRKKKEMEALERRGDKTALKSKRETAVETGEDVGEAPEAKWPETKKAWDSEAKEVAIARDEGDVEVDPALFYVKSINNLKLTLGSSLTTLSPDVSRLSGLLTLIISGNGLTELPESVGKLKNLKVLEAENNQLVSLPSSLSSCKNLEILRVSNNKIKSLASLDGVNTLVTLVADNNKLTTLDDFTVEAKERLVTLSARMNQITDAPAEIHQCSLLAEIFLKNNKIEDVPGEWGELKEKKVRSIELDNNPIADPKIKKMMGKSANFVKELLTYLRKNGKKSASKKKKKPAKAASSDDEDEPEPEPAAPEKKSSAPAPAPADDESETEEELEARMAKMNKKEREKFKRKLAEERQAKAAKEAAEKRKAADAAAAARLQAAKTVRDDDDDDESDIDSDDELALLARKKKQAGKSGGGFLYAMTDEQREQAEKAEAERLLAIEMKKRAEEEAKRDAEERAAAELAAKTSGVKLTGEGVYGWEYTSGQFKSTKVPHLPKGAKGPCVELEIPKIIVGRLIGQKGATIKGVQDRSKAMVSIDETKGSSGNSLLRVRGTESAMESARMLMNNALGGKR
tara:strand:- start:4858 stop:7050 length:2193 start_codon:yes stop_codon:yes gene_type:complete